MAAEIISDSLKVLFYGSSRVIIGNNSLSNESKKKRNELIGNTEIHGVDELIKLGVSSYYEKNPDGSVGQSKINVERRISIVPFNYHYSEKLIIQNLEKVLLDNESKVKAHKIQFPLLSLKLATREGYSLFDREPDWTYIGKIEREFKSLWCCFGHYYLHLLKRSLINLSYSSQVIDLYNHKGNLINEEFTNRNGWTILIHADSGL